MTTTGNTIPVTGDASGTGRGLALPLLDASPAPHEIVVEPVKAFRLAERNGRIDTIFDRFHGMRAAEAAA